MGPKFSSFTADRTKILTIGFGLIRDGSPAMVRWGLFLGKNNEKEMV